MAVPGTGLGFTLVVESPFLSVEEPFLQLKAMLSIRIKIPKVVLFLKKYIMILLIQFKDKKANYFYYSLVILKCGEVIGCSCKNAKAAPK